MNCPLLPRSHYPTLNDCTYLNQASLGLMGQPAVSAMTNFIEQTARHGNAYMSDSDEVAFFENLRAAGAEILKAEPSQLAIVASASEILGQLPFLLRSEADSTIVTVRSDFPALTRPWLRLAEDGLGDVIFVDDDPAVDLTDALIAAIDSRTAVVAVSHVQYATGTAVDIRRLREATWDVGASLIVDVTQSAGTMNVDARAWQAEAVVASGYKWLGGHGGVALAVLSAQLLQEAPPLPGWMGAPDPFDFDATQLLLADDARRFTQSTMSYASMVSLTVGIEQLLAAGIPAIEHHADSLAAHLIEAIRASGWEPFRAITDPAAASHIISLGHPSVSGEVIQSSLNLLREHRIVCSARGGRIRVSLAPYNSEQDLNVLGDVLVTIDSVIT